MVHELRFDDADAPPRQGLVERILSGEVFVARGALQHFGLFDMLFNASLEGVRRRVGDEAARLAAEKGFERIHEWVSPADIPAMTDAVYAAVAPVAAPFLRRFVKGVFPEASTLYYEETPNVRFHIPYDLAIAHNRAYRDFAKRYGEGKIAAHGPHRDSWLDCPSNGVNLWFAIGPVRHGNGLTIYESNYRGEYKYKRSGDIADGERLDKPTTFELAPGDAIFFHTDHLHGSELNRTDETRFVISFRMTFGKPHFPNRHFHRYVNADLAASPFKALAHVPAMIQPSYARSLVRRMREKLDPPRGDEPAATPEALGVERNGLYYVPLADLPVGRVRGVTETICVARLSEDACIALTRRCPHSGGDFANGWVDGDSVVCPWHNLPFNAWSGRSPCRNLAPARRIECKLVGGEVVIDPKAVIGASAAPAGKAPRLTKG